MEKLKRQIEVAVEAFKNHRILEAEKLTKELIEENPNIAFLYNLLGLIFVQQQKFNDALTCYKKGIKADPNFSMIYNNLGLLYFHQKNDKIKAEEYYKKSISLDQKIPEPYNNLASIYKSLDKFDEAITYYKKAIEINPNFVTSYHNLGTIYVSLGNFTEAKNKFEKALEIDPNYSVSHRTLSRLIKYTDTNDHFKQLKQIYEKLNQKKNTTKKDYVKSPADPQNSSIYKDAKALDKINIAFALGKAYEDIKNFDKSFNLYNEANTLYKEKSNFSLKKEKERFAKIKDTFHKNLYEKYKNTGSSDESPIFIIGMPRSGTTLVEQILSSHPKVFGGDERIIIPQLLQKNFGHNDLKLYFENILDFDKKKLKIIGEEYINEMKLISKNSEIFTDKLPENFLWVGFIKLILPKSKIIHCLRNPKDNCLSLFKNHFPSGRMDYCYDLNDTVEYYNLYYDLMNFWYQLLPNFIYTIKYENLISKTEPEIRNLLKVCNLTWDKKCLNFYKNTRIIKTASDVQARNNIYSSSVNSWRKYEKHLKEIFEKLKY